MRVLVTGGAGFIGSHLVDSLLAQNNEVIALDNLYLGKRSNIAHNIGNPCFKFIKKDLLDMAGLKKIFELGKFDAVFHLAANSDIQKGAAETGLDLKLNFLTTYNVLECMRLCGTKQIIFASTSAIYGESESLLDEDHGPLLPISFYGASKLAAEAYVSSFSHNYGIQAWICRFPNVVGERSTHGVIFDFLKKLGKDRKRLEVLGDGKQCKPYLYVKDLVEAILFVWERSKGSLNYYNIGTEDAATVSEIAKIVIEESGLNGVKIEYTGGDRGWKGDVPRFKYSLEKIGRLGWRAPHTSTEAVRLAVRKILGK